MDLRGEGARPRDRRAGGAAVAVARVPDGVAAEPPQPHQRLLAGAGELGLCQR